MVSAALAGKVLLIALALLAIFHLLVLFNLVPSTIIWGGQIGESSTNLWVLEITALVVTVLFALSIAAKVGYIKAGKAKPAVNIGVWIVFAYLILNTVGNLASGVTVEKLLFTPITLISAFCALRLALEP
jgi:hypothetical protein